MSATLYRMPPLPVKTDLFKALLAGPHETEIFLEAAGKPVLSVIVSAEPLGEYTSRLYEQILRLIAEAGTEQRNQASLPPFPTIQPRPAVFHLRPGLSVDLDRYEVRREHERLSLRAREGELLRILLLQPRRYIKAEVLAEAIGSEGVEEPEHPIEEMISHIRQKLGETPYHPSLLLCKRHAGYAIFPDEVFSPISAELVLDQPA